MRDWQYRLDSAGEDGRLTITYCKGHFCIWTYRASERWKVLPYIDKVATNPDIPFDWHNAREIKTAVIEDDQPQ